MIKIKLSISLFLFISFFFCISSQSNESSKDYHCKVVDQGNQHSNSINLNKEPEKQIYQLFNDFNNSVNDANLEQIGNLVTEDAEFWTNSLTPLTGRAAFKNAFKDFLNKYSVNKDFECYELIIRDDVAYSRGMEINKKTPRVGGETIITKQRAFSVIRKGDDGKWRFSRGMTNLPKKEEQ